MWPRRRHISTSRAVGAAERVFLTLFSQELYFKLKYLQLDIVHTPHLSPFVESQKRDSRP